jgi:hypothetical protein
MATKTSLHVSLFLWLLVFYPDCRLQGVQASATSKTLDKGVTTISTAAKGRPAGVPIAESQVLEYTGTFPAVNASSNVTLLVRYDVAWPSYSINVTTWWNPTVGNVSFPILEGNIWAVEWDLPPLTVAAYQILVTIIQVSKIIIF